MCATLHTETHVHATHHTAHPCRAHTARTCAHVPHNTHVLAPHMCAHALATHARPMSHT